MIWLTHWLSYSPKRYTMRDIFDHVSIEREWRFHFGNAQEKAALNAEGYNEIENEAAVRNRISNRLIVLRGLLRNAADADEYQMCVENFKAELNDRSMSKLIPILPMDEILQSDMRQWMERTLDTAITELRK